MDIAMSECIFKCRYSPWTGTKYLGLIKLNMVFNSSCAA